MKAPPIVPTTLPTPVENKVPPATAAVKESRLNGAPAVGSPVPIRAARNSPAKAAIKPVNVCVIIFVLLILIPARKAVSRSAPIALTCSPKRVLFKRNQDIKATIVVPIIGIDTGPILPVNA